MKKIILSIAVLVLSVSIASAQSVDEIVAKNLNATGGVAKLQEIKSVIIENAIKIQGLEIENQTTIVIGKAMRTDSKIMGNSMIQAFDGTTAWSITPVLMGGNGEPLVLSEEMSKSLISQADPFPLLDYVQKGTRVELVGSEKIKEKDAYHLKITPKVGAESEVWIDVTSGVTLKLKTFQNGQLVEVIFSNYAQIEGINFAMSMEMSTPATGDITVTTKSVKLNSTIDKLIFEMPIVKN